MKILVTGGNGYIGSMLCNQLVLNKDYMITNVDNCFFNNFTTLNLLNKPNYNFIKDDVNNLSPQFIKQFDVICHLAALVGAPLCDKYPELTKKVNLESVIRIVDTAKEYCKIIFPTTNSVYGTQTNICTEESPINPLSLYAETKCKAEEYLLKRPHSVSFRLATVCGTSARPRMDLMVNNFVAQLYFNNTITLFEPNFKRNFVGVKDVVSAMIFGFSLEGLYNVGLDSANCTKQSLAEQIRDIVAPTGTILIGDGEDPDKRDYNVSSTKIRNMGFCFRSPLHENISQVQELCKIIGPRVLEMKNY